MSGGHASWDEVVRRPLKNTTELGDSPNTEPRVDPTAPVPVVDLKDVLDRQAARLSGGPDLEP